MRKWFTCLLLTTALAQIGRPQTPQWGEVDFSQNRTFAIQADRRVYFPNGSPMVGTNWVAQLYYGTNASQLIRVATAPCRFRNVSQTDALAGTWAGRRCILTGIAPGTQVALQVRIWDSDWGSTYEEARTNGGAAAFSATFHYRAPPPGSPPQDYYIENFRAYPLECAWWTEGPPEILEHPASQDVAMGQAVILSAVVSTNACWTQWQFNGTNLLKFGRLRINNVQPHHAGDYRLIAMPRSSSWPAVTSQVARLTVREWPKLTSPRYQASAVAFYVADQNPNLVAIETAPDLNPAATWTAVYTNTSPFWYTNSTPTDRQRFYRTVLR